MAKPTTSFTGSWHIMSMTGWETEDLNEEVQAHIEFKAGNRGSFRFGYVQGQFDYRTKKRDGQRAAQFCWDGEDSADGTPLEGVGWANLEGDELNGMICFHLGDDLEFVAKKAKGLTGKMWPITVRSNLVADRPSHLPDEVGCETGPSSRTTPRRADIWKDRDVTKAFLTERSTVIPDRPRQLEVLLRVMRLFCLHARRILDVGTGDGLLLATLLEAFPDASGVGVDFSPLMLEQARQRLAKFGPRATTVEADLQATTWKDAFAGPFDAIVSGFAIHHLPHDRKQVLYQEIYDLLSPGGVFLNCEHVASATPRVEQLADDAMTEHLYLRRKEKGDDVTLDRVHQEWMERPDRAANILALVEDQCRWLREIGFKDVDCFWKYFELAIFGGLK